MEKNIGGGYVYIESGSSASYVDEGFSVESLNDVEVTNPENGQVLAYDSSSEKWVNSEAGGGILVITIDSETLTMDRTWNEIKSAVFSVVIDNMEENNTTNWSYVCSCEVFVDGGSTSYIVRLIPMGAFGEVDPITFSADSPSGFPTLLIEPEP